MVFLPKIKPGCSLGECFRHPQTPAAILTVLWPLQRCVPFAAGECHPQVQCAPVAPATARWPGLAWRTGHLSTTVHAGLPLLSHRHAAFKSKTTVPTVLLFNRTVEHLNHTARWPALWLCPTLQPHRTPALPCKVHPRAGGHHQEGWPRGPRGAQVRGRLPHGRDVQLDQGRLCSSPRAATARARCSARSRMSLFIAGQLLWHRPKAQI